MTRTPNIDLNTLAPAGSNPADWTKAERSTVSGGATAHFGDVAAALERFIIDSDAVVGCVAWVSSRRFITALSCRPVSLVVNKEWDLRAGGKSTGRPRRRDALVPIPSRLTTSDFPQLLGKAANDIDAVRCMGHITRGSGNQPLMHSKFLVRLTRTNTRSKSGTGPGTWKPTAVWTGSINLTANAENNIENGIEIDDPAIAAAYLSEWARILKLSEPLDFAAGKAEPGWDEKKRARTPPKATVKRKPSTTPSRKETASPERRAAKKPGSASRTTSGGPRKSVARSPRAQGAAAGSGRTPSKRAKKRAPRRRRA